MPRPEAKIEDAFVDYAKSRGCKAYKLRIDGQNGFPDRTVVLPNSKVFFIEFKAPGGTLSQGQKDMIEELQSLSHQVYVLDDVNEAKAILDFWMDKY